MNKATPDLRLKSEFDPTNLLKQVRSVISRSRLHMVVLLLAAFALRIYRLDAQSIWWDEGISLHLATSRWAEIVADRLNNIHPPLYFFILKIWVAATGVTPFAARYLSVLASWLQISAVYAFCKNWIRGKQATENTEDTEYRNIIKNGSFVWLATSLMAISPLSVVYGQEIRVYAMLPLVYVGLLVIGDWLLRPSPLTPHSSPLTLRPSLFGFYTPWFFLGLVEWIGLHLHYISLLVVAYTAVWMGLSFYRQGRWVDLRRWFTVQLGVGLVSLPWFLAVLGNWTAVQAEANTGTFQTEPVPLSFLISQVWVFHLTGLAGALSRPEVQWLAAFTALFVILALLQTFYRPETRRQSLVLLTHWLVPLTLALFVWGVRSFSHPRYVAIFAVMLIPLLAYLMTANYQRPTTVHRLLFTVHCLLFTFSFIALSLIGLQLYFFDPGVAKDDVRGVARYLETAASADDLILIPDTDWSLPFEYHGAATVRMPDVANPETLWANLQGWTETRRRVFVMDYEHGTLDWQQVVPFALERAGVLTAVQPFAGLRVRTYELDGPVTRPAFEPVGSRFGFLVLQEAWAEQEGDTAVTLALRWRVNEPVTERYSLTARLLDVDGWVLAAKDDRLVDENGRPTEQWRAGQIITTYHVLPVTPGTPPLSYQLVIGLYKDDAAAAPLEVLDAQGVPSGQTWVLGEMQVKRERPFTNPYNLLEVVPGLPEPVTFAGGLQLLAVSGLPESVNPGQPVIVQFRWQTTQTDLPDLRPRLALVQNSEVLAFVADAPALGRYPTHLWQSGEVVIEHRRFVVPPTAIGTAELVLSLGQQSYVLGEIQIIGEVHLFEPPAVTNPLDVSFGSLGRLVGYDLPTTTFTTAEPISLTLYWQATETGNSIAYTVFTHLLDENGRLIAQHDSPPDNGRRPTTGWLEGEFIVDPHLLTFRETGYSGTAQIEVGLYDPVSGVRVMLENGRDAFILPVIITIK